MNHLGRGFCRTWIEWQFRFLSLPHSWSFPLIFSHSLTFFSHSPTFSQCLAVKKTDNWCGGTERMERTYSDSFHRKKWCHRLRIHHLLLHLRKRSRKELWVKQTKKWNNSFQTKEWGKERDEMMKKERTKQNINLYECRSLVVEKRRKFRKFRILEHSRIDAKSERRKKRERMRKQGYYYC